MNDRDGTGADARGFEATPQGGRHRRGRERRRSRSEGGTHFGKADLMGKAGSEFTSRAVLSSGSAPVFQMYSVNYACGSDAKALYLQAGAQRKAADASVMRVYSL